MKKKTITISSEMLERLKVLSKEKGIPSSYLIVLAINEYLEKFSK
ncbi:ribbon-helix-helix domain-containing protein [Streptobacillus moniliformis]|nr:ribbon-helix-helix domain-containing protein [Streptobacillus moniliformis]